MCSPITADGPRSDKVAHLQRRTDDKKKLSDPAESVYTSIEVRSLEDAGAEKKQKNHENKTRKNSNCGGGIFFMGHAGSAR